MAYIARRATQAEARYTPEGGVERCGLTRAADVATLPSGTWRNSVAESFEAEFMLPTAQNYSSNPRIIGEANAGSDPAPIFVSTNNVGTFDVSGLIATANTYTIGATTKAAATWASPTGTICLNGGAVASASGMPSGFSAITTFSLMGGNAAGDKATGYFRRFRYWPRALSNTELQQVTT